jgi:hypothetical protein
LYDALEHTGTVAVFKVADLPVYERAAPLSPILFPALFTHDIQYVHGAAVGLPEGGVLLAGVGGAGKSTTALACLDSALKFAGDDYCAVTIRGEPVVYSLYNSAKGDAETVARLKFLESFVQFWDTEGSGKAIWFLQEHLPHQLIAKFPLRAILIPRVTGEQDTRLARASSHEALVALVPSTIAQLPDAGANVFHGLAALVRNVPAWHLLLGTDMKQIPATILALLNQLGGRGAVA